MIFDIIHGYTFYEEIKKMDNYELYSKSERMLMNANYGLQVSKLSDWYDSEDLYTLKFIMDDDQANSIYDPDITSHRLDIIKQKLMEDTPDHYRLSIAKAKLLKDTNDLSLRVSFLKTKLIGYNKETSRMVNTKRKLIEHPLLFSTVSNTSTYNLDRLLKGPKRTGKRLMDAKKLLTSKRDDGDEF